MKERFLLLLLPILLLIVIIAYPLIKLIDNSDDSSAVQIPNNEKLVSEILDKHESFVNGGDSSVLNLRELTDFDWDRMYLVVPYNEVSDICEEYDLTCDDSIPNTTAHGESVNLLLFTKNSEVISYMLIERAYADFAYADLNDFYNIDNAKFKYVYNRPEESDTTHLIHDNP